MPASIAPSKAFEEFDLSDLDSVIDEYHTQDVINFIDALNRMHTGDYSRTLAVVSIQDLEASGVPGDILDDLVELHESGVDENIIVKEIASDDTSEESDISSMLIIALVVMVILGVIAAVVSMTGKKNKP